MGETLAKVFVLQSEIVSYVIHITNWEICWLFPVTWFIISKDYFSGYGSPCRARLSCLVGRITSGGQQNTSSVLVDDEGRTYLFHLRLVPLITVQVHTTRADHQPRPSESAGPSAMTAFVLSINLLSVRLDTPWRTNQLYYVPVGVCWLAVRAAGSGPAPSTCEACLTWGSAHCQDTTTKLEQGKQSNKLFWRTWRIIITNTSASSLFMTNSPP